MRYIFWLSPTFFLWPRSQLLSFAVKLLFLFKSLSCYCVLHWCVVVFTAFPVLPEQTGRQAGRHAWPFLRWTWWPQYVCLCARKMSRVELYSPWQLLVFTDRITRPRCPYGTVPLNNNWLLFPFNKEPGYLSRRSD